MKSGHAQAQDMFLSIGEVLGYQVRRQWTQDLPTDGVWMTGPDHHHVGGLPIVVVEVAVSESPKAIRGSVATIEAVSPALGIVLIHEDEIRRSLLTKGIDPVAANRRIERNREIAEMTATTSRQRIEVWTFQRLCRRFEVVTGRSPFDTNLLPNPTTVRRTA